MQRALGAADVTSRLQLQRHGAVGDEIAHGHTPDDHLRPRRLGQHQVGVGLRSVKLAGETDGRSLWMEENGARLKF